LPFPKIWSSSFLLPEEIILIEGYIILIGIPGKPAPVPTSIMFIPSISIYLLITFIQLMESKKCLIIIPCGVFKEVKFIFCIPLD